MPEIKNFPNNQDEYRGAEAVMRWLYGRTSGVFGVADNAAVSAFPTPRMAVQVSDGTGWITDKKGLGCVWWIDNNAASGSPLYLAIDAADAVYNRIDRVIVEWNTPNYTDFPVVRILKGAFSSNAAAPDLTNDSTTRQISLARIYIKAGATDITAADITDERLDTSVCGLVTDRVTIDTSSIHSQFESLLSAIQKELADLEAGTAVELKKLQFRNVSVSAVDFVSDTTYQDFPYRAGISLSGVIEGMIPEVVLSVDDALSGNYAPVSESYNGGVYLYAGSPPDADINIPIILLWRGN